jgi:regulator of RNase E activity RraA
MPTSGDIASGMQSKLHNEASEELMPLHESTKNALLKVGTSTLSGILNSRNLRNMYMQDVNPLRITQSRMVGLAFTMRFIPSREDKAGPNAPNRGQTQVQAMEECPPGHVLVIDSRGDARAASAGDLFIGRLMARGCAGIVTDGGLRDSEGILKTGLPAYLRRPSSPPSPIVHQPIDLDLPIGCGGVAVYPGDVIVGDCDGVVVIPIEIVDAVAEEALAATLYDEFAEEEVARGRSLPGLFPNVEPKAQRDFEAWKLKRASDRS